ncbi:MAG: ABC transporter permease [Egibacteraceae bacterium]
MTLALAHARSNTVELLRQPGYWLPSVAFPSLFFVFFGISAANQIPASAPVGAEVVLTQFLLFGVLGIMFFQFGVGIAEERQLPWDRTLRVLPASATPRFVGRVLSALLFSVFAMVPVVIIALLTTNVKLDLAGWVPWFGAVFAGAIPFGLMGITLGFATTTKAALPIANIGFLLMSFFGDLFIPVEMLPSFVQKLTPWMPTFHWKVFVLDVIGAGDRGDSWQRAGLFLIGWTAFFLATALFVYRRDEGARYR